SPPALQIAVLRLVPPTHKKLTLDVLTGLLAQNDSGVQLETGRVLSEHPDPRRIPPLLDVVRHPRPADTVRAEALVGVAARAQANVDALLALAQGDHAVLRAEALRALVNTNLTASQRALLEELEKQKPATADLVARVLGKPFAKERPRPDDL